MLVRARVIVSGRVQGVFFRASAADEARRLALAGWARNRKDGAVELVFEGPAPAVEKAVEWARSGPADASVQSIQVVFEPASGEVEFKIAGSDGPGE